MKLDITVADVDCPEKKPCPELDFTIECKKQGICITPKGYGDFCSNDGDGVPIFIEFHGGDPRVIIWSDINQEDPTHIVNLAGAKESLRKDE